jgi:transposase InsO family protein
MKSYYKATGLGVLCGLVGMTRQAYYEYNWRSEKTQFEDAIIVDLVNRERQVAKRVGAKRLHLILTSELESHGITIGRDKFLEVLRANDLLVKRRRRHVNTTMSRHRLRKYPNLAKDLEIDCAEQLWVSDITYLTVAGKHCYLILITDAYSRKVVGYNFGRSMDTAFCMKALQTALADRAFPQRQLMHHSDRGVQYCSKGYVELLQENGLQISMTEHGDPLENALAERMNGIFKDNFALDTDFISFEVAKSQIDQAIQYYNHRLPHSSIDMLTPTEAHYKTGQLKKHWKSYWKQENETPEEAIGISNQTQS